MAVNNILTKEGLEALKQELKLLEEQQPIVKSAMVEAREQGDLSENAGFHISKAKLAEIEKRMAALNKIIIEARVIEKVNTDTVGFGVYVKVFEEHKGSEIVFRIVNSDDLSQEADNITLITMSSPVAKALMGKTVNVEIIVETRLGERSYKILAISDKPM